MHCHQVNIAKKCAHFNSEMLLVIIILWNQGRVQEFPRGANFRAPKINENMPFYTKNVSNVPQVFQCKHFCYQILWMGQGSYARPPPIFCGSGHASGNMCCVS